MKPEKVKKLARQFMINSVQVAEGDRVWIEHKGPRMLALAKACAAEVEAVGGHPLMIDSGSRAINQTIGRMSATAICDFGAEKLAQMKSVQGYIRIKDDAEERKIVLDLDSKKLFAEVMQPALHHRLKHVRWLVVEAPTKELAATFGMPLPRFENKYFHVCMADGRLMEEAALPLQKILAAAKEIKIVSPAQKTNLTLRKDGIPAALGIGIAKIGHGANLPDGEGYTEAILNSITGNLHCGPSNYDGKSFGFLDVEFGAGRIIKARADTFQRTRDMNAILDRDEGARFTGEFAVSFNPFIEDYTENIGWGEKMQGGIHIAAGNSALQLPPNGNESNVHWDMVQGHHPKYGGGELHIDGELVRKDGLFLPSELEPLNPANLIAAFRAKAAASVPA